MENLDILTMVNRNEKNEILNLIQEDGKLKTLSLFAQILDKRAYVTIDSNGNLKRKEGSMILPIFAFFNDNEFLADSILKYADLKERQILDKIERFSNIDMDKVKENLMKTMFNGNIDFAKKYGKELFLRDKEAFFNLLGSFVTIGNSDSLKGLFLVAFDKLMEECEYEGNVFYLLMAYITKFRDNTSNYENSQIGEYKPEDIKKMIIDKKEVLNSTLGLGILANLRIVEKFNLPNRAKILSKLAFEIENYQNLMPLSEEQKQILELFL